jgi:hypothetical protein
VDSERAGFKNVVFLTFYIPPGAVNGAQHDPRIATILSISSQFSIDDLNAVPLFGEIEEKSPSKDGFLVARLLQSSCGEGVTSTLKLFHRPSRLLYLL